MADELSRNSGALLLSFLFVSLSPLEARGETEAEARPQEATAYRLPGDPTVILEPSPGGQEIAVCTSIGRGPSLKTRPSRARYRVLGKLLEHGGFSRGASDPEELVRGRGGENHLFFDNDAIVFCTRAPEVELPLALWIAATRFAPLRVDEEQLDRVRAELERDLAPVQNDARGKLSLERVDRLAHLGDPSRLPTSEEVLQDLEAVQLEELSELHQALFVSTNAAFSLSGAFERKVAEELVEKHLGKIPRGAPLPRAQSPYRQTTERFSTVEDASQSGTAVYYAWRAPEGPDEIASELGLRVLGSQSRLGTTLTGPGGPASHFEIHPDVRSGRVLRVFVQGRGSYAPEPIEEKLNQTLSHLASSGPTEAELESAHAAMIRESREGLMTPLDRAHALSAGALRGVDPMTILRPLGEDESWARATREEVGRAVRTYLTKRSRSVVEIYPKGWKDPWEVPMPTFHIVSSGETLTSIARARGTTVEVIAKMNRLDPKKAIFPGDKLKVPRGKPAPKLRSHQVRAGDTLLGLAKRYGVSAAAIAEQNGIGTKQVIRVGQTLEIPNGGAGRAQASAEEPKAPKLVTHEVTKGESLGLIAKRRGLSVTELAKANGLDNKASLKIGQKLVIPQKASAPAPKAQQPDKAKPSAPAAKPSAPSSKSSEKDQKAPALAKTLGAPSVAKETPAKPQAAPRTHTVKSGETLSGIAHKYHISTRALCQANGISEKKPLRIGQKLTIPGKE